MKISSFHVREATNKEVPVVVSIPHCGIYVPEAIRERFASGYIRSLPMTDWYLHTLCDFLPGMGVTTIYGTYSRFVADIDAPADVAYPQAGQGSFVALKTPDGEDIYNEPPTVQELYTRRELVYAPYHARLSELLQSRITRFGSVILVDLHSFPPQAAELRGHQPRQVYLGDDKGRANPGWLTGTLRHSFTHAGYSVAIDDALHGNYIVGHYGNLPKVSAVYTALRWDLYLDAQRPDQSPVHAGFRAFRSVLSDVFTSVVSEINAGSLRMNRSQRIGTQFAI
jgi:N-formylglutamate amidohydrolase